MLTIVAATSADFKALQVDIIDLLQCSVAVQSQHQASHGTDPVGDSITILS